MHNLKKVLYICKVNKTQPLKKNEMKQFIPYTKQQKDVAFALLSMAVILISIITLSFI